MRMAKYKIFVDGQSGTTGLKIHERLARHPGVEVLRIEESRRKETEERRRFLNAADIAFLCLPDVAAREAVALVENARTRIIDASTAHRTDPAWAYGLPELGPEWRARIAGARRVSIPGCYASGFILALHPLVDKGVVPADHPVTCHAVSGYTGGGKERIAQYEAESRPAHLKGARHYALGLAHKHLPEMRKWAGLAHPPLFTPILGDFAQGMAVAIPLVTRSLPGKPTAREIHAVLASFYAGQRFVEVMPFESETYLDEGCLNPMACNETNRAELFVFGHEEQVLLLARLDNLGKGASGAAVQCMNIMLGLDEGLGL